MIKKIRNGFTIMEMLAVILIIGVLGIIIIPKISDLFLVGKKIYYNTVEKELSLLAKDYFITNSKDLPTDIPGTKVLSLGTLVKNGYIKEMIKDVNNNPCNNSFVVVTNQGNKKYDYTSCLICSEYISRGATCIENMADLFIGEMPVYTHGVKTTINQELIKDTIKIKLNNVVNSIPNEEKTLDVSGVDVNKLGDYYITYDIPSRNIYNFQGIVRVVDNEAPEILIDSITTTKNTPINVAEEIVTKDNYYSSSQLTVTYEEIDNVNIAILGEYRILIRVTDPSGNATTKEVILYVSEKVATFSPNKSDWTNQNLDVNISLESVAGLNSQSWKYKLGQVINGTTTWGSDIAGVGSSATLTISNEGLYVIKTTVTYTDGTILSLNSGYYKIDKTIPSCGIVVGSSTTWTNVSRAISTGCYDNTSNCIASSFTKTFSTTAEHGSVTVVDLAGNSTTCPVNVYVDVTNPDCGTITGEGTNATWINSQRQITVGCSDSNSGCVSLSYTKSFPEVIGSNVLIASDSVSIKDIANNITVCPVDVYYDKVAPEESPTVNAYAIDENGGLLGTATGGTTDVEETITSAVEQVYLSFSGGTDSGSGVKTYAYSTDGGVTKIDATHVTVTATEPGATYDIYTKDNANNYSNVKTTVIVKVDNRGPELVLTAQTGSTFAAVQNATIGIRDYSGLKAGSYKVKYDWGTSAIACNDMRLSETFTVNDGEISKTKEITMPTTVIASDQLVYENGTPGAYTFTADYSGTYKLEVWGGSGGYAYTTTYRGGYGGYSTGNISLNAGQTIYIYVGGAGADGPAKVSTARAGGYNGGGNGLVSSANKYVAGGGGATHIAKVSGLLNTLSSSTANILIVAGGGGGGDYETTSYYGRYGEGGGFNGVASTGSSLGGGGGTQTAGGATGVSGSFGQGGNSSGDASGGGAGYYGGATGTWYGGGGGGSGYIANSSLTDKYMYCYNCTTSSTASTLTYTTTNVSSTATSNYAKSGNGYVKITAVSVGFDTGSGAGKLYVCNETQLEDIGGKTTAAGTTSSANMYVDAVGPIIGNVSATYSENEGLYDVTVNVTAQDAITSVKNYYYALIEPSSTCSYSIPYNSSTSNSYTFMGLSKSVKKICVYVTDNVDNKSVVFSKNYLLGEVTYDSLDYVLTYTGTYEKIDEGNGNWKIKFLTSGNLTVLVDMPIDMFLVGGGGAGCRNTYNSYAGAGGGGGNTTTVANISLMADTSYAITVGNGAESAPPTSLTITAGGPGMESSFGTIATAAGGTGGGCAGTSKHVATGGSGGSGGGGGAPSRGAGGSNGANGGGNGGTGQQTTTCEFGQGTYGGNCNNGIDLYSGGGSSAGYSAGAGGGGANCSAGTNYTGGGGGACMSTSGSTAGGTGVVIIRNYSTNKNPIIIDSVTIGTYTGDFTIVESNPNSWKVKFLTSGIFYPKVAMNIDIFAVGGGGSGCRNNYNSYAGAGGGGGYTATVTSQSLSVGSSYAVQVGIGGLSVPPTALILQAGSLGDSSSFGALVTAAGGGGGGCAGTSQHVATGGSGGSGGGGGAPSRGSGGSNGANGGGNGGTGQNTTTCEFGEGTYGVGCNSGVNLYSGGGASVSYSAGEGGGGAQCSAGTDYTGGGGGACSSTSGSTAGGFGVVIIRKHQ